MNKLIGIAAILTAAIFASSVLADPITAYATVGACTSNDNCLTGYVCYLGSCQVKGCGVSATGISFGTLSSGTTVGGDYSVYSTVTNGGTTSTTELDVNGNNWQGYQYPALPDNWMNVYQTYWEISGGSGWTNLQSYNANTGTNVAPGTPIPIYFALTVPQNQPQDTYYQTITFTGGC